MINNIMFWLSKEIVELAFAIVCIVGAVLIGAIIILVANIVDKYKKKKEKAKKQ